MLIDNDITTKSDLKMMFKRLGLESGTDVMVHSSMKSLGYVVNGALIDTIGVNGTILMPAHTGQLTDPSKWNNPPVPKGHIKAIKENIDPFNKVLTPVRFRGIIPSTFLFYPKVERSDHPLNSVGALGKLGKYYTNEHDFDEPEGIQSPIGKLYENKGKILLLGVGLTRCTAIHLAEYIADVKYLYEDNPTVLKERIRGVNQFIPIKKYPGTSEYFNKIIPELRYNNLLKEENFRQGVMTVFSIKQVVDYIVSKLKLDPDYLITP